MADETGTIRWHQGFRGGIEHLLWPYRNELDFREEFTLSKEALRVDLIILKKTADVVIDNDIGRMFRKYNILEYKSPEDSLSIDDFYKTISYACLYKALGETTNAIPAGELTASVFRHGYPRELFRELAALGATVERRYPGVYYVSGIVHFPTQIVVGSQLDSEVYAGLRVLAPGALERDVRDFISQSVANRDPGFRQNVDAVLQIIMSANPGFFERRDSAMSDALRALMLDVFAEEIAADEARRAADEARWAAERAADKAKWAAERAADKAKWAAEKEAANEALARKMILRQVSPEEIMYYTDLPFSKLEEIAASVNVPLTETES